MKKKQFSQILKIAIKILNNIPNNDNKTAKNDIILQLGITTAGPFNFLSSYDCDLGFCLKLSN